MLLAVDLGNTNINIGIYDGQALRGNLRLSTHERLTADEAGLLITGFLDRRQIPTGQVKTVVLASVVPCLTGAFIETSQKYLGCRPIVVSPNIKLPIRIDIDQPEQVGADRIANAAAGFVKYQAPVIIVDFGTATNIDVVSGDGAYIGGVLFPGPETSMADLARRAARLFVVSMEQPDVVVGRSTEAALKSGLFYGTIGQVDYIVDKILEETGFEDCRVIATGGLAAGIEKHSRHIELVEPDLTLDGLRLIGEMN